jgi:hypothetical protein
MNNRNIMTLLPIGSLVAAFADGVFGVGFGVLGAAAGGSFQLLYARTDTRFLPAGSTVVTSSCIAGDAWRVRNWCMDTTSMR